MRLRGEEQMTRSGVLLNAGLHDLLHSSRLCLYLG